MDLSVEWGRVSNRCDNVPYGLGRYSGVGLNQNERHVRGAGNYAVLTVSRQCGQLVLSRHPLGIVPLAGREDDQRLCTEVNQRCCLP